MGKRSCGDCRLCCKVLDVREDDFHTPGGQWCEHACPEGCAIYRARPATCQEFECSWLSGLLPAWATPERTHLVVYLGNIDRGLEKRRAWVIAEGYPGAAHKQGAALVRLLSSTRVRLTPEEPLRLLPIAVHPTGQVLWPGSRVWDEL